ncbi:MAG: hypothetical protein ACHP7K_01350 [Actinomycetales bacterium]
MEQSTAAAPQASVYRPVLVRGLIAAVFGCVTVFWQQPTELGASLAAGLYLLALGVAAVLLRRRLAAAVRSTRAALGRSAAVLAVAGAVVLVLPDRAVLSAVATVALVFAGALELIEGQRGMRTPALLPLARDWRISGALLILTGIILTLVSGLGSKAQLGVLGGGAMILAVQLLLAGLSYRHDSAKATADGA